MTSGTESRKLRDGHSEDEKQALCNRFVQVFRNCTKKHHKEVDWIVDYWGGIRGEHRAWPHRLTPISLVVWQMTGEQPTVKDEIEHLDELGFGPVSLEISKAIEGDTGKDSRMSLRNRLLKCI